MDWEGFARWLDADPRHRQVFDETVLAVALLDDHRELLATPVTTPASANDEDIAPRTRRRWPLWLGTGLAASLAAVMIAGQMIPPTPVTVESGRTAMTVDLGEHSSATLAPNSRLVIGGRDATQLALEGGAYFDIRHDPSRKLTITAGDVTVSDIGTRFDVRQGPADVMVEVADGEVAVRSDRLASPVRLPAGQRFMFDATASRAVVSAVDTAAVGEWRDGRLTYDSAPLQLVAADLGRYANVRLVVPDALARRHFSGSLFIGNGESAVRDLAQLMQLELVRDGSGYRLESAD